MVHLERHDTYAAGCGGVRRAMWSARGSFTLLARPNFSIARIMYQVGSNCHHFRPCRAEYSKAWWLLCQPSPNASSATHLSPSSECQNCKN